MGIRKQSIFFGMLVFVENAAGYTAMALIVVFVVLPLVVMLSASAALYALVIGAPLGALTVLVCVRWINRRTDPHHANRPPDPP